VPLAILFLLVDYCLLIPAIKVVNMETTYVRESKDTRFAAWYCESWYYGHHYRFYSYSPWHTCGLGTRYDYEDDARRAVDHYMDVVVPEMVGEGELHYEHYVS